MNEKLKIIDKLRFYADFVHNLPNGFSMFCTNDGNNTRYYIYPHFIKIYSAISSINRTYYHFNVIPPEGVPFPTRHYLITACPQHILEDCLSFVKKEIEL